MKIKKINYYKRNHTSTLNLRNMNIYKYTYLLIFEVVEEII